MKPFDDTETGFAPTALTLSNARTKQGMSFPTWGNPEREALNQAASAANTIAILGGF